MTLEEMTFFDDRPEELAIYAALTERLADMGCEFSLRVQKTQISFYNRYLFACVSFLRAKKKAELPPHFLTVTFGLGHPKTADRIAVCTEAARHRWTHHVVVGSVAEIDDELIEWLKEAYDFSNSK